MKVWNFSLEKTSLAVGGPSPFPLFPDACFKARALAPCKVTIRVCFFFCSGNLRRPDVAPPFFSKKKKFLLLPLVVEFSPTGLLQFSLIFLPIGPFPQVYDSSPPSCKPRVVLPVLTPAARVCFSVLVLAEEDRCAFLKRGRLLGRKAVPLSLRHLCVSS